MRPSAPFRRALAQLLVLAPLIICGPVLVTTSVLHHGVPLLYDFRACLYDGGRAVLHGADPYRLGFLAHQVALMRDGRVAFGELDTNAFSIPVYPAFANVLIAPLAALPFWIAGVIDTLLSVAALVLGLRLLGVRDWRCHALALISWPVLFGLLLGTLGPLLVLGAGVAWRWRDRLWPPALAIAAMVATKVFPWTLAGWLLVTRRHRAFVATAVVCALMTIGAWAVIGFHGLAAYPRMLSDLSELEAGRAVSVVTVLVVLGVPIPVASAIAILCGLALLAFAAFLARTPGGDRRAFGLAVIAALIATPIVWEHYMVLLFVPIALVSPELSRLWLAPLGTPIASAVCRLLLLGGPVVTPHSPAALTKAVIWIAIEATIAIALCRRRTSRSWPAWRQAPTGMRITPAAVPRPSSSGLPDRPIGVGAHLPMSSP